MRFQVFGHCFASFITASEVWALEATHITEAKGDSKC